ncbi:hypothetical protein, partial [Pseudomonas donghuensis]|uniref:hypothetical protein n=1 Tax=Pseudomonas donghuensis TaxID=1163398 RepID=UPI001CB944C2
MDFWGVIVSYSAGGVEFLLLGQQSRGKLNWPNDFGHLRRALLWRPIGGKISAKILLERIQ